MATLVSVSDVESRLMGRTFTPEESAVIAVWIEDLEADIRTRITALDTLAADPLYLSTVKRVVSASIKRVLDNPKGLRQMSVSIDDYTRSETIDSTASAGLLYIADDDWGLLVPALEGDAFTIRPYGASDQDRVWTSTTSWEPL
jgi:hypothetical protein